MTRGFGVECSVGDLREPSSPSRVWQWLLRAAALLAPPDGREEWNARWSGRLSNLWVLIERGELAGRASTETARLLQAAIAAAFWMRFNRAGLRRWLRGPGSIVTGGCVALALLALLSRGFATLRELVYTTIEWKIDPRQISYDPRADFVVAHFVPITMALLVGAVLVLLCGRLLGHSGWKYWMFLAGKLLMISVLVPMVWIEGGGALRAHIAPGTPRVALATAFTLVFFGAFGCCVIWAFADQRRRCPVCLGRLALPVTFGSWASVFNPATTEMVCDEGHGSLCVAENEISGDDRWIKLDASWKEF
jgi:hypothetical protein